MTSLAVIDMHEIAITPIFKIVQLENVPQSEVAGHPVMENHEVVEVRFAGHKHYSPVFPADAFWKKEGNRTITYAERWPEQYAAFKAGDAQQAAGTPLEMLREYGVTPEQLSLCRALKIYSIEALYQLEGQAFKSLGIHGNKLREAAKQFMGARDSGAQAMNEIEALKARIAELETVSTVPPVSDSGPEDVAIAMTDADRSIMLKDQIAEISGVRPKGNPSIPTLEAALKELQAA